MKKKFITALLLLAFLGAWAQQKKIDTFRVQLKKATRDTDRYQAMYKLGKLYHITYPDSAIIFHQQAYIIATMYGWKKEQGRNLNGIANAYSAMGDYASSIQYYFKALKAYEVAGYGYGAAQVNNNIGATYVQKSDNKIALPYLLRALKPLHDYAATHELIGSERSLETIIFENLGEAYLNLKKLDSAQYYLVTARNAGEKVKYHDLMGAIQRDLGEIQERRGNNDGALQLFRLAVATDHKLDDAENLSIAYLSIAKLYHKQNLKDSAIYYAHKALDTATNGKFVQDVLNASQALYTYYDETSNVAQAYKYFKIATAAKDSLFSQDKIKQLLTLDFDEKQRQQELEAARADAQNRIRLYILSGILALLVLLALVFWRNSKQRKKANKTLKAQKEDIETALAQLQLTQTQLVQSEKMASLGELTAGIAHEIQNPLNFVNNFSEVNAELIDELEVAIANDDMEEIKAIAQDIRENEKKITIHGRRADFIVKGMLLHSRTSSAERQLTNVNQLANEYLKLSYHGLRAKDKSFTAEMTTHFDENLPEINIVQQDIGRVFLNLVNNAFYAVNQKQKAQVGTGYRPEVTMTTSVENGGLVIKVKDNGTGIPDNIKDKIMHPFFTTKPTGEGTGLGLSLTHDIVVKGHAGSIHVDSTPGEGTEFTVCLPLTVI